MLNRAFQLSYTRKFFHKECVTCQQDLPTALSRRSCAVQPSAKSLNRKCPRIYISKWLTKEKLQSKSCCPSKISNLQTKCVDSLLTSVGRSTQILAQFTQVERSRMKLRSDEPPLMIQQWAVNSIQCGLCDADYVGCTCRYLYQQTEEHKESAARNGARGHRTTF